MLMRQFVILRPNTDFAENLASGFLPAFNGGEVVEKFKLLEKVGGKLKRLLLPIRPLDTNPLYSPCPPV